VIVPSSVFNPWDKTSIANAVLDALSKDLPFPKVVAKNEVDKLIGLLAS
jgi:hypothetical protein